VVSAGVPRQFVVEVFFCEGRDAFYVKVGGWKCCLWMKESRLLCGYRVGGKNDQLCAAALPNLVV
jgi:hypothetical protein